MKKFLMRMTIGIFSIMIAFSMTACNNAGSNKAGETTNKDTSVSNTGGTQQTTTTDTTKKEKTDAPSPGPNQQNTKQGTNTQTWDVPDAAKNKKNPVKVTAESKNTGKELYAKHCASCHGRSGDGNGPKAATLKTKMTDFKSTAFQSQTEGAIFYKTSEGKGEMPAYKKKLSEEDIWDVVTYVKSMNEMKK